MVWKKKHKLSESYVGGALVDSRNSKRRKEQDEREESAGNSSPQLDAADIYYEEDGLQRIHPYYHKYATHAKGRWVGRSIFAVFSQEFRDRSADYYEAAIQQGLIELNGAKVEPTAIVRNGDLVTHYIHRHEPPVGTAPIRVVADNGAAGLLAIDKPPGVPVHPSGRYNYNSVIRILEIKHGLRDLFPINRLDRLTSGLMLIVRNAQTARAMETDFRAHRIQKEYVCRVRGRFPAGLVVCDQPIRVVAHKLSLNCVDPAMGKPSATEFQCLAVSPDEATSIVYCRPKTGRTHQIRVHLQFLGHPIANDPLYCNEHVWGREMGKGGCLPLSSAQQQQQQQQQQLPVEEEDGEKGEGEDAQAPAVAAALEENENDDEEEENEPSSAAPDGAAASSAQSKPKKMVGKRDTDPANQPWLPLVQRMEEWKTRQELVDHVDQSVDTDTPRLCTKCATPMYPDPTPDELSIWLHAWRYSGPGWTFQSPLPDWASEASGLIDSVKYINTTAAAIKKDDACSSSPHSQNVE
ncbi:DRAP deaminase [Coemansia sp. Benny D160-2]|nr:DRAP deaminase [Coemansia sp. Benny D160-2]